MSPTAHARVHAPTHHVVHKSREKVEKKDREKCETSSVKHTEPVTEQRSLEEKVGPARHFGVLSDIAVVCGQRGAARRAVAKRADLFPDWVS